MGDQAKSCVPQLPKPCPPKDSRSSTSQEVDVNKTAQDRKSSQDDSTTGATTEKEVFIVPFDARFPNMNQTRRCWQNYVDFYRCQKLKGEDYAPCEYFKKIFTSLCPQEWIEQWNEQRDNGTFAGEKWIEQ